MSVYPQGPAESPGFLLWRVTLRWQRLVAEVLRPLDLTHAQFVLLACTWWLGLQGHRPNQLAIATQADTNIQMTSEVLRRLELKGLVVQVIDPKDRRARTVTVTDAGRELAQRAVTVVERVDQEFFGAALAGLTPALQALADFHPKRRAAEDRPA